MVFTPEERASHPTSVVMPFRPAAPPPLAAALTGRTARQFSLLDQRISRIETSRGRVPASSPGEADTALRGVEPVRDDKLRGAITPLLEAASPPGELRSNDRPICADGRAAGTSNSSGHDGKSTCGVRRRLERVVAVKVLFYCPKAQNTAFERLSRTGPGVATARQRGGPPAPLVSMVGAEYQGMNVELFAR